MISETSVVVKIDFLPVNHEYPVVGFSLVGYKVSRVAVVDVTVVKGCPLSIKVWVRVVGMRVSGQR